MNKYIALLLITAFWVPAYAEQMLPQSVVRDAFGEVAGGSSESTTGLGSHSEARTGAFSLACPASDWASRVRAAKEAIKSRLSSRGWTLNLNINQEPTGKVPFEISMHGEKQRDVLLVHVVVFLPRDGLTDVAYSEQISRE